MDSGLKYFPSIIPGLLAASGNYLGGYYTLLPTLFLAVIVPLLDYLSRNNYKPNKIDGFIPTLILLVNVWLTTLSIAFLIYSIHTGKIAGFYILVAAVSTGFYTGAIGITTAHELIHRKTGILRFLGIWNLFLVNYSHFYIEHIRVHHKYVGLENDAATARFGENYYRFFGRTLIGQFTSAFKTSEAIRKKSRGPLIPGNFVLTMKLLELIALIAAGVFIGWQITLALIIQSFIAVSLLELVNYIEHYGLSRKPGEKISGLHSWQSDSIVSRYTLIELTRHSDHHLTASKPYHQLNSLKDSPELPNGYFVSFFKVLIPPLWFKSVNPLLKQDYPVH